MKRHAVHICYDVEGWCYFHRATAIQRYAPDDFEVTIGPSGRAIKSELRYDLVLQLCYGQMQRLWKQRERTEAKPILVAGFNAGWRYRGEYYDHLRTYSDHLIFNNYENWEKHGRPPGTSVISNGIDRDIFKLIVDPSARTPLVLWTGSEYHRKNGDVKGYDDLLLPLRRRLDTDNIPCDYRLVDSHAKDRYTLPEMAEWYNTGTIYVVASRMEGTPNPALEHAACGGVICATRVGNMPEIIEHGINGVLVDRTLDDLYEGIKLCCARYVEMAHAMQERIDFWDWRYRAPRYYCLFRRLIEGKPR